MYLVSKTAVPGQLSDHKHSFSNSALVGELNQQERAIKRQKQVTSYCRIIGRHWTEIVSFFFVFGSFGPVIQWSR